MTTEDTTTHEGDFYDKLMAEIQAGNVERAVEMVTELPEVEQQLEVLSQLSHDHARAIVFNIVSDIDRDHVIDLVGDIDHARARARDHAHVRDLARARARARDLAYARDLALTLSRARDHARDLARDVSYTVDLVISINKTIIGCLEAMIVRNQEEPVNTFRFTLMGIDTLTPHNLANTVAPYLQAIFDLQHVISDLKSETFSQPRIVSVSQNSPIRVEVTKVPEAIRVLLQYITPADRKSVKHLYDSEVKNVQADFDLKRAEVAKIYSEVENTRIETVISILKEFAPKLSETERLTYLTRLLQPISLLLESPLKPDTLPEW